MGAVTLGAEGLLHADLVIARGATFACAIEHLGPTGEPVDHGGWEGRMRLEGLGEAGVLDPCVGFDGGDVTVVIPARATAALPAGCHLYDLMLESPEGEVVRLMYGWAHIVSTYAMGGE